LEHPRDKALIAMVYLLAGRITEVLKLRPKDITVEEDFMVVSLWTAKRKKGVKTRKVPVPLRHPLVQVFAEWFKQVKPNQPIFYNFWNPEKPISRVQAWKILKKAKADMWLHLLRHIRLSELVDKFNFDPFRLQQFAGWTDVRPASFYVHLGWKASAEKMREK
jgi:integrase